MNGGDGGDLWLLLSRLLGRKRALRRLRSEVVGSEGGTWGESGSLGQLRSLAVRLLQGVSQGLLVELAGEVLGGLETAGLDELGLGKVGLLVLQCGLLLLLLLLLQLVNGCSGGELSGLRSGEALGVLNLDRILVAGQLLRRRGWRRRGYS